MYTKYSDTVFEPDFFEFQTHRSSCGPTSLKMFLNYRNIHKELSSLDLFNMLENQIKGTPWWRMAFLLDKLNLDYFVSSGSYQELRENIEDNFCLVSYLVGESGKHWVLAQRNTIYDPSGGVYEIEEGQFFKKTKKRDFLFFNLERKKVAFFIDPIFHIIDKEQFELAYDSNFLFNKEFSTEIRNDMLDEENSVLLAKKEDQFIFLRYGELSRI